MFSYSLSFAAAILLARAVSVLGSTVTAAPGGACGTSSAFFGAAATTTVCSGGAACVSSAGFGFGGGSTCGAVSTTSTTVKPTTSTVTTTVTAVPTTTTTGASKAAVAARAKRTLAAEVLKAKLCPTGLEACYFSSRANSGYECIDTMSELAHCGSCGNDCEALDAGAGTVTCQRGQCVRHSNQSNKVLVQRHRKKAGSEK